MKVEFIETNTNVSIEQYLDTLPKSFQESVRRIEEESSYQQKLQEFCLTLIPITFQYFALLYSSEYLYSKHQPSQIVTDSLWNMIKRPSPGKWVQFIREVTIYFNEKSCNVITKSTNDSFCSTMIEKEKPKVKLLEENGRIIKKLDYYEALINVRNQFAHGRNFNENKSKELFIPYFKVWSNLVLKLKDIFLFEILIYSKVEGLYYSINRDSENKINLPSKDPILLWDSISQKYIRILPMVITQNINTEFESDILFLEELKGKSLTYLYSDGFIQKKEEYIVFITLIENKTIFEQGISSSELTSNILAERIFKVTKNTLLNFENTKKYIESMYINRKSVEKKLTEWLTSEKPGCILSGYPGTGKTSLIANWSKIQENNGNYVLLLEASKLSSSDLKGEIKKILALESTIKSSFDAVYSLEKNKSEKKTFIIILDGINEFFGTEQDSRNLLLREINSFIDTLEDYNPIFKCLITTREDIWKRDFTKKDSADFLLKRSLYFHGEGDEFPRIIVDNFSEQEVIEVYQQAQKTLIGMSPSSEYEEIPEKTKELIKNPFLMRLVLQTFNDEVVPSLSENKLKKEITKQKTINDKVKVELLFRLLDRMAELRKTEIELDEFLYSKSSDDSKSSIEKSAVTKQSFSKLLFDPRPRTPYRALIEDGLIEERSIKKNNDIIESLSFTQEKIVDILYNRKIKQSLTHSMKNISIVFVFYILLMIFFWQYSFNYASYKWIKNHAYILLIDDDYNLQSISENISIIVTNYFHSLGITSMTFVSILFFIYTLYKITAGYVNSKIAQKVARDLPSRFKREQFNDIHSKKMGTWGLAIIIAYFSWLIYKISLSIFTRNEFDFILSNLLDDLFNSLGIIVILFTIMNLIFVIIVVLTNSKSPLDANLLLGKNETQNDLILNLFNVVFLTVVLFTIYSSTIIIDDYLFEVNSTSFNSLWDSKDYIFLKSENPDLVTWLNADLTTFLPEKNQFNYIRLFIVDLGKIFIYYIFPFMIVFHLLATYLLKFPIEKYLRRKFH